MIPSQWQILDSVRPTSAEEVLKALLRIRTADPSFLKGTLKDLEGYLSMHGLSEGAELMAEHLFANHKIVLVGDYDCDGITSVAQMSLFLKEIGYQNYDVIIPLRAEGYGVPLRAVTQHPDAGLFVAMDCGTMDVQALTRARAQGADCIVIDHHEVPEHGLAPATVLINPKQPNCPSPFKELCSSGLTLLFLARLRRAIQKKLPSPHLGGKYLVLATIGTISDMVPLVEANRIIAQSGLSSLNRHAYAPVERLVRVAGLSGKVLTAGHLGYYLGPRINAAGRIGDARVAFDLLTAECPHHMHRLAQELNGLNAGRQQQEDRILTEIRRRIPSEKVGRTLVMADPAWSPGIVGIVASKLQQELHYGPTIVGAVDERQGIVRGSARSIPGFDIHRALKACDDLLVRWGGHRMAAGLTVALDRLEAFKQRFEEEAQEHPADLFVRRGRVDLELDLNLVSSELLDTLKQLEPHGLGNPTPTFSARRIRVSIQKTFGRSGNHLRLLLDDRINGIFWRGASHGRVRPWKNGDLLDIVFQVGWDDFCGGPVLDVKDVGCLFKD